MTNIEFLACAEKELPFKRQNCVDQYLVGILSVLLDEATWTRAVNHAIELEARTHEHTEAIKDWRQHNSQGGTQCA